MQELTNEDKRQYYHIVNDRHLKINYELESQKDRIIDKVKEIKKDAERIKEELDHVIEFASLVLDDVDNTKHFQLDPHNLQAWRDLPQAITEVDTRIKAYSSIKRLHELMK